MSQYTKLYQILDYRFKDESLLNLALTHRSSGARNNERLEFLGDAILGMVITTELFRRFADVDEGILTRLRSSLVKGVTLSKIASELGLGEFIQLGSGELKSGGFRRDSTLANVVEAIIGAIYLDAANDLVVDSNTDSTINSTIDSGIKAARKFILNIFEQRLQQCEPSASLKDPKTRLQEYLQAKGHPVPSYEVVAIEGKEHMQTFQVSCVIENQPGNTVAKGSSRRKAEQAAAEKVLKTVFNEQ